LEQLRREEELIQEEELEAEALADIEHKPVAHEVYHNTPPLSTPCQTDVPGSLPSNLDAFLWNLRPSLRSKGRRDNTGMRGYSFHAFGTCVESASAVRECRSRGEELRGGGTMFTGHATPLHAIHTRLIGMTSIVYSEQNL
jgi:hypothetical protein